MSSKIKKLFEGIIISTSTFIIFLIFQYFIKNPTLSNYIILLFSIILLYFALLSLTNYLLPLLKKIIKIYSPKIGILNGYISDPKSEYKCVVAGSTNVTAFMWFTIIKKMFQKDRFVRIRSITMSEMDDSYTLIINPFGENYPEKDTVLHSSFNELRSYMEKGGFILSIGAAFYYHQNTMNSHTMEPTFLKTQNNFQGMNDSFLYKKFSVSFTMDDYDQHGNLLNKEPTEVSVYQEKEDKNIVGDILGEIEVVNRFRALKSESNDYIPLLRERGKKIYPLAAVPYSKGLLLLAGMKVNGVESNEFKIIIKLIKNLVSNRFRHLRIK